MATGEILWITPKWPLPVEDGARVATRALVRNLPGLGVKLDLLALAGNDESCDEASLRREFCPHGSGATAAYSTTRVVAVESA